MMGPRAGAAAGSGVDHDGPQIETRQGGWKGGLIRRRSALASQMSRAEASLPETQQTRGEAVGAACVRGLHMCSVNINITSSC